MMGTHLRNFKTITLTIALSLPIASQAQYAPSADDGSFGVFTTQAPQASLKGQVNLKLNSQYNTYDIDSTPSTNAAAAAVSFGLSDRLELSGQVTGLDARTGSAASSRINIGLARLGVKLNLYANRMSGFAHGLKLNVANSSRSLFSQTGAGESLKDEYSVEALYLTSIPLSYRLKSTINVGYAHNDLRSNRTIEDQIVTSLALQWRHSKRLSFLAGVHAGTTIDSRSEYKNDHIMLSTGIHYALSSGIGLEMAINRNMDGLRSSMAKRDGWGIQFGLNLALETRMSDSDRDGVDDRNDLDLNTPRGWAVDRFGVPMDTDKDGVADTVDLEVRSPFGAKVDAYGVSVKTGESNSEVNTGSGSETDTHGQAASRAARKRVLRNYKITVDRLPTTGFGTLT